MSQIENETAMGIGSVIIYGVTGSGKSAIAKQMTSFVPSNFLKTIAFHPDYTYSDFVGARLPVTNPQTGFVEYKFQPGPFTKILRTAIDNPHKPCALIIEDINRGNAAAIFGDMMHILAKESLNNAVIAKAVFDDENSELYMPNNLTIVATLNTSLPNSFHIDPAMRRRFYMRAITDDFSVVPYQLAYARILDTSVTWKTFCLTINKIITENQTRMMLAEDKRLGGFFVTKDQLSCDAYIEPIPQFASLYEELESLDSIHGILEPDLMCDQYPSGCGERFVAGPSDQLDDRRNEINQYLWKVRRFPEMVIGYLWDDVFKFNPEVLFDTELVVNKEDAIRIFSGNYENQRFRVFKSTVQRRLFENTHL